MHPILFKFGGIPIYTYGVLVATGVLSSLWYGRRQAPRAGVDPDKLWNMGIYFVLVALIVAKIWLILSAWDYYLAESARDFQHRHVSIRRHVLWRLVGGVLTILLYTHFQKMPLLPTLDTCAAALPHRPRHRPHWAAFSPDAATANRLRSLGASRSRIPSPRRSRERRWEFICIRRSSTKRRWNF